MRKIFISVFLLGISASQVLGQSSSDISKQLWFDFNPTWFKSLDLEYRGKIGMRKELDKNGFWRYLAVPQVRYYLGNEVFVVGGIGSYYTFNNIIDNRWENRLFQGMLAKWPQTNTTHFEHYLRLEQRFDFNTATWESLVSLRLRFRMMFIFKFDANRANRYWRIRAGGEGFVTLSGEEGQSQEQARASISIERSLRSEILLRWDVTWQKESLFFVSDKLVDSFYISFRLYYTWGKIKIVY
jgi:hypothetical protein